ncbi:hypothetical protein KKF82_07915 [Patescibacteria group bacterium]|nr:hypothetical protein [Patescibacteria group bacterium]
MTVRDAPNPLVHRVEMNPGNEVRKAKTRLDEIFDEREERAAKRFSAAELEKMALESENEAARLRGEPPKYKYHGGEEVSDDEKEKKKQDEVEQRERLMASATALINSGLDPKQVGQMLLGLTPTPAGGGYPPAVQGMGFEEVLKIVTLIVGKRETDEIKGLMNSLDKRIDELAKGGGAAKIETQRQLTPMDYAKQQVEYISALEELGIIRKPEARTAQGESLDVVKEQNRHKEKMEEISGDKDYKEKLVNIATELPERIGRGIAGQFTEEETGGGMGSSVSSSLEYKTCTEEGCGFKIQIPPNAGNEIECPKCGAVYTRDKKMESNVE